jgi:hypothetical protein|tara:strand:- start:45 stop:317 length:273 start_codon:yes stop_codon:yes gene_type:complete
MKTINEKIENFKNYVWSFYGKDQGIYKDFFNNNLTIKEVEKAIKIRISKMKLNFDGDSIDREIVRDIIFKMRDPKAKTEHILKFQIKEGE